MRRRHFLLLAAAPILARNPASAEVKTARIGLIQTGSRQENQSLLDACREGLSALGWSDGSNVAILDRWAEGRTERLPGIVKELIGSGRHSSHTRRKARERNDTDCPSRRRRSRRPRR